MNAADLTRSAPHCATLHRVALHRATLHRDSRAGLCQAAWTIVTHLTRSEDETAALARGLAATLRPGDVLLLSGNLGAGKTAFVRGLAEGLGIDPHDVSSPTFTLVHEYRGGRLTLYHVDLYRLERAATDDLGLEELGARDGVLAIEWPDRLTHELANARVVSIEIVDETTRRVTIGL